MVNIVNISGVVIQIHVMLMLYVIHNLMLHITDVVSVLMASMEMASVVNQLMSVIYVILVIQDFSVPTHQESLLDTGANPSTEVTHINSSQNLKKKKKRDGKIFNQINIKVINILIFFFYINSYKFNFGIFINFFSYRFVVLKN